ncbi:MAG: hypothetical protein ACO2OV_05100, partial [Thermoproteota archaeon]
MQHVVRKILHLVGEKMMKSIAFLLVLMITITLINPMNVKASNDIIYEVVKKNPDLVITGCNETYVYWQFNYRIFNPPVAVRDPGLNESKYIDKIHGDYDSEGFFIVDMLAAKYDLKHSNWYYYYNFIDSINEEIKPLQDKIFKEKGELGINWIGVWYTIPPSIVVTMYKITNEKVSIVLEYLKPYAKKYNAVVFFIEDYFPASIYEKQLEALIKFYEKELPNGSIDRGDGWKEYLKLVEEYYDFKINIQGWLYSPGIADLPIPPNATFNKEFVEKAVSILRKYAGCEVPLVANFIDYRQRDIRPAILEPS